MSDDFDPRVVIRYLTPRNLLMWLIVITAYALAIIAVAWIAAKAWQTS